MAKSIGEYKKDYEAARARGDAAGMKAANDGANAVRASLGLAKQDASADIAKVQTSGSSGSSSGSSKSSGSSVSSGGLGTSQGVTAGVFPKTTNTSGMTPQQVLALGQGPLALTSSGGGTKSAAQTQQSVQQPQSVQQQASVADSPEYKALMSQLDQVQQQLQQKENDYSDYVKQLQEAAKAKSLAELEEAYQKNVNAIDAAKEQISPQYTDARNQVAGQAAVSRKNWQETASALGINSGAAGQSDIAQNIAMQNNLAALDKAETSDLAALDLQRTQATTDYNAAIAQAEASGDYELAASLYAEKVRADEAARADQTTAFQQLLQKIQLQRQIDQDALAQQNYETSRQDTLAQQAWQNRYNEDQAAAAKASAAVSEEVERFNLMLNYADTAAETAGEYSMLVQLGIYTQEQADMMRAIWQQDRQLAVELTKSQINKNYRTGTSASGGGSKTTSGSTAKSADKSGSGAMTLTTAKELAKNGQFDAAVIETLRDAGYSDGNIQAIYGWDGKIGTSTQTLGAQNDADTAQYESTMINERAVTPAAQGLLTDLQKYYASAQDRLDKIEQERSGGGITENDYLWLLSKFGLL